MTDRIAIAGVAGRMGRQLVSAALRAGFVVTGGSERAGQTGHDLGRLAGGDVLGVISMETVAGAAASADIWVDFTTPDATLHALDALKSTPVRAVIIGTTGFTPEQDAAIADFASRFAIVKSGNFSLGVNLLCSLVRRAAASLPASDWDIEIAETHHRHKVDAPSGTALMVGRAAAKGRGQPLETLRRAPDDGQTGPRPEGSIGFSVRRAGGVFGEHDALFASANEVLRLSHTALDRGVFADGAITAARWALAQPNGLYSMDDVLSLD